MASLVAAVTLALVAGSLSAAPPADAASTSSLWAGSVVPAVPSDPDTASVEIGTDFTVSAPGTITALRFYKGAGNSGTHVGHLWGSNGALLATRSFSAESASGWQQVALASPITVTPGVRYAVSYRAPNGRYAADPGYFANGRTITSGPLTALSGVYNYGTGRPTNTWQSANYYVDVVFTPRTGTTATSATTSRSTTTTAPSPSTRTTAATTTTPVPSTGGGTLALPRIPWEGGPAYWKKFPQAVKGHWDDPSFFPIVLWYGGISSNSEAAFDKKVGINTYIGMWEGTPFSLFTDNNLYWIGGRLNSSFSPTSGNWVGNFLDDEVDGRFSPADGRAHLKSILDGLGSATGRFDYANFTQMVIGDLGASDANAYVNDYTDAVSVDMYWYTIPFCDWVPYRGGVYLDPVAQSNCRTSSSYGKVMNALRQRDAADGRLQAPWQFVEMLNGGPGGGQFTGNITPAQLKGAVMSSVINEARGIVYFNQSLSGPCQSANIVRQAQVTSGFCGLAQVNAATEVNSQIRQLAPVINTQSYVWNFGRGLDTMLKTSGNDAYVFAMVDGNSAPGSRTFALPPGVAGRQVQVLFENRTLTADSSGSFTDRFSAESSYHIYKIALN